MTFDVDTLFRLLPAVYRTRDAQLAAGLPNLLTPAEAAELAALAALANPTPAQQERVAALREKAGRGPLKALLAAFAEEIAVVEENLAQLYDDLFIETCAPWVVPYIGDLVGSEPLHALGGDRGLARAEVAHTVALRRRKGTAAALEQLARDLTGWEARAVEFFSLLGTTQYMNHLRRGNLVTPSMRDGDNLAWTGTAFDTVPRRLDVRRVAGGRGRYNIPNVGIFLWRVGAHRLREAPATADPTDPTGLRHRASPLGNDTPLYTRPEAEPEITHLAEPVNVPVPITRRILRRHLTRYYGPGRSLMLHLGDDPVAMATVRVCNLSDTATGWAHDAPAGTIAVDPELGRLAVAADLPTPGPLRVTWHYGAFANLGGGEYASTRTESPLGGLVRVPDDEASIQDALDALGGAGVVEITDNGVYTGALAVTASAHASIELRAALGRRPTLDLTAPLELAGGEGSSIVLSGLLVTGEAVVVTGAAGNELRRARIVHSTLVPGLRLTADGAPTSPGAPSLVVDRPEVEVAIDFSIVGALRVHPGSSARVADSVVDACAPGAVAYAAPAGDGDAGGELSVEAATVVGTVRCERLDASNSLLLGPADVTRRQEGCVRFSYLPLASLGPRRFRAQPTPGAGLVHHPRFTSLRYSAPAYGQLSARTPPAISAGADDESEMGAFHHLYQPQREANLATRLEEYLRVGLEAGIFYES